MVRTDAPTGTVTFLFTDIEGSTRLWDHHPDAMADALSTHDDLLQSAIDASSGYVFSKAGDGWGVAFESPGSALDTALTIQDTIGAQAWPGDIQDISIRMGLHTGTSAERNGDYFGTTVNRAARVSGVADGGQVFVTDAVHTLVADEPKGDWRFRDLGEHRLRDLSRAERIWQLDRTSAPADLAVLGQVSVEGNIPRQRTSVIGRDTEISTIADSVRDAPLVSLVGVGGVGKTTIAKAVGTQLSDGFAAGAWFVDLTATEDPEQIAASIAAALGIAQRPDMNVRQSLIDALGTDQRLLILDNAEQQIDAVADLVDEVLAVVPDASILVTSREQLGLHGEVVHRIGPLDVVDVTGTPPAVTLFVERARAVAPDLPPDAFDDITVRAICSRLDGLPLAIELAASQSETMSPAEILQALETDSLDLQSASRSTAKRHRSLDDLVRWSYDLLDETDRVVFGRLSVFTGGCTMDAALAVCTGEDISQSSARGAIATLVRKSMIVADRHGATTRLTMLETLRHFAAIRLDEADDRGQVARQHAAFFADLSAASSEGMVGPDEATYLGAMLDDTENLRQASLWASEHEQFDLMEDLGKVLPYLMSSKMRPGMNQWILSTIDRLPPDHVARLDYALALGHSTLFGGDIAGAPGLFAEMTSEVPDRRRVDAMHRYLRHVTALFTGNIEFVIADGEEATAEAQAMGLEWEAGAIGTDLALALFYSGDVDAARRSADRAIAFAERSGNPTLLAWAMYTQGEIGAESDPLAAIETLEEAVEYALSADNEFVAGISLVALSSIAGRRNDIDTAFDGMHRAIRLWRGAGNRPQMWTAVRNLVEMLHGLERDVDALTLNAAVEADGEKAPELFGPFGDQYRSILTDIEAALDPDEADKARRVGSSLTYGEAAAFALNAMERTGEKTTEPG